jgi:RHS repeat-associated protein
MKIKMIGLFLLFGVVTWLSYPQALWASGACTAARFHDWNDNGCNQPYGGEGGMAANCPTCPPCCGMPRWWVSEPYEDLWIKDTPLSYRTSSGQEMNFTFFYRQRFRVPNLNGDADYYAYGTSVPRLMDNYGYLARNGGITNAAWGNNWKMDIVFWDQTWEDNYPNNFGHEPPVFQDGYEAYVLRPEGGIYYFYTNASNPSLSYTKDPGTQVWLQPLSTVGYPVAIVQTPDTNGIYWGGSDPQTNGFCLHYPDGSKDIFGLTYFTLSTYAGGPQPSGANSTARALLTERIDPQGRVTRVGYENTSFGGFRVKYVVDSDGRTNTFLYYTNNSIFYLPPTPNPWMLTEIDDPYGRKVQLGYAMMVVGNSPGANWGILTNITDAAGMTSYFQYDAPVVTNQLLVSGPCGGGYCPTNVAGLGFSSGWITNLITPYGTNSFAYYQVPDPTVTDGFQQRAVYIQQPEGAQQFYLYQHNAVDTNSQPLVAATATAPTVSGQTFDAGATGSNHPGLNYRNTFRWGPRQFEALSSGVQSSLPNNISNAIAHLTEADCTKAELKHWLWQPDGASISASMSSERDPSPDAAGSTPGLRTWYTYVGQSSSEPEIVGTDPQVSCVARLLPDTTSQYTTYHYFASYQPAAGLVSDHETTYSQPGGGIGTLTTSYGYAANGIDLTSIQNSAGQSFNLGYNGNHQITSITNALNQVTTLSWLDSGWNQSNTYYYSLSGIQWPSGLSAALSYNSSGTFTTNHPRQFIPGPDYGRLQNVSWSPSGRSFTINAWTDALPYSVTDDRGLTVTNTWDGLNRRTSTIFPDGTSVSNVYDRLDLGAAKDRLNNWTHYVHDGLQHLTAITNANQAVTLLSWCGCGSLENILDATGTNLTQFFYDNQGNLTNIAFPDYTSLTYQFDLAGRMTQVSDGAGRYLQLGYNNQGLITSVSGAYGALQSIVYDAVNRPISVTDPNGMTVTNNYDAINELLSRTWLADGISEGFGYSTNGLIAYTNRDQQATYFLRDGAERILAITNANKEVAQFAYDSLNNITNLVDGLQHTTKWQYNLYGWLTNKMDGLNRNAFQFAYSADGWITNRWTPEKGNTGYGYDNVGNLKSITYPQSSISYSYDADNRLTNMVDAVGTSAFSYTAIGQLANENGPWANDTVSYLYSQMLRTNLTLTQASGSWVQGYGYDNAWRLQALNSPAGSFGYSFNSGASLLVAGISLPNGANIANSYDNLARLTQTVLNNQWGHTLDGYVYTVDALGLRTNIARGFGLGTNSVAAGYDNIGQITSWIAKEANGALRLNEQLGFGFDAADNLHLRTNNALIQTFTVDAANELTGVGRTGTLTESGSTPAPANSVTVNGQAAQTYGDFTFARTNLSLVDGNNNFTNIAVNLYGVAITNTLTANLPLSATLQYDNNGNLTNDGMRSFAYNTENELTNVFMAGQWRSGFVYDGLGRRRIARDYTWSGGVWTLTNEIHYLYDGYLLIQERDTNNNVLVTYTRGLDLSDSLQGAGGIGGLLARTDSNGSTFYHADGAGNITALMDGNENIVARYLYGPFGKLVGKWGSMADANEMQFSSMPQHDGLSLYPFRNYDADLQRWPNQDPIGERGGINLYRAMNNDPVNEVDPLGLWGVQFGNFNIGYGNPNYAFDSSSWYDVANGAAAVADGLLPQPYFQDLYQNGNPFDENGGSYPAYYQNALDEANNIGWAIASPLKGDKPKKPCPPGGNQPMMGMAKNPATAGQLNNQIRRGQAPRGVVRADPAQSNIPGSEPHVHYENGTSSTQSGGVHDAGNGYPNPSNAIRNWLEENGWTPPPRLPPIIEE